MLAARRLGVPAEDAPLVTAAVLSCLAFQLSATVIGLYVLLRRQRAIPIE